MPNEVFISYSRKDYTKVRKIKTFIDDELGIDCWMDLDGIESGDQFKNVIISAINRHNVILFMMTTNSMNSPWALKELSFAEYKKKKIVLVDIDHSPMTDAFRFDYGDKDNIDWNIELQRNKLMNNLKRWLYINDLATEETKLTTKETKLATGETKPIRNPQTNNVRQLLEKAKSLYLRDDYKEAFKLYYEIAILYRDAEAEASVGSCYYYGKGVKKDYAEALKWYEKAAIKNHSLAIARMKELKGR